MGETKTRILVVDDDARLRELLNRYLSEQGYSVRTAIDGNDMNRWLARERHDLMVLDLMMPGEDGLSICRRLRGLGDTIPIIMLTAKGDDVDRIVGLEVGADDYLAKPFNPRELLARIRAVLRRGEVEAVHDESVHFGPFRLDVAAQALAREGVDIPLTQAEFTLLKVFVEHPNRALSRDQIMDWLKGYERDPFDRSIDVHVARIRAAIEDDPPNPRRIITVRGAGYVFAKSQDA